MDGTTRDRLERGAMILSVLDGLRKQSGIADLGRTLENMIVFRELADLTAGTAEAAAPQKPPGK